MRCDVGKKKPRPCDGAGLRGLFEAGKRVALVSTGVGVERLGGRGQIFADVKPRFLPDSESRRRIPASCPFPRNLCRQLRATRIPLAASDRRSEASFTPPSSPVQLGE